MSVAREQSELLAQTVASQFLHMDQSGLLDAERKRFARGEWPSALWDTIDECGFASVMLPEDEGGFGGGWEEAFVVLFFAGAHAIPLPIAETMLARKLLSRAKLPIPPGPLALFCANGLRSVQSGIGAWQLSGNAVGVRWAIFADHLVASHPDGEAFRVALVSRLNADSAEPEYSIAREPIVRMRFDCTPVVATGCIEDDPFLQGALGRVALMAGALSAALTQSVTYSSERQQFGKAIGKFQAIQHALASLASEAAAVSCAGLAACRAVDRGGGAFEVAAAKLRANRAVQIATSIAHQVHGAIGFTQECRLHRSTQSLWAWRSEYGNDRFWATRIAELALRRGPREFWPYLTALSDSHAIGARSSGSRNT